ncbi:MAG: hypothetical protein M3O46_07505 [Myxococcota bacterium]|nr:hypothetical protein [Myxococcota bacterium]
MIRKETLRNAWGQGMGRHKLENVVSHGDSDIDALSTILGNKPYLFGAGPTSYDAPLFGTIANVLAFPPDSPLAKHVRTKPNLVDFVERVSETYWQKQEAKA